MLALRLVRTSRLPVLARRLLVAVGAGAVGFLLLGALGHAVAHPEHSGAAAVRLLWCAVPLAALVQFAVAATRTDPCALLRTGLDAVGMGPARLPLLAAVSTVLYCGLGSALALVVFVHLRGGPGSGTAGGPGGLLDALPLAGAAADPLGAGRPLPWGAVLTLLAVPSLTVAGASAAATWLRTSSPARPAAPPQPPPVPVGLPWGVAVTAVGLALETYAAGRSAGPAGSRVPLPGSPDGLAPGVVGGWLLVAAGLVLAGPGLVHLCGLLLAAGRPGALRLLSGRVLREEASLVGRSLGVLCAVAAGTLVAVRLYGPPSGGTDPGVGPLAALGAVVVLVCAAASALNAAVEFRTARASANDGLLRLGVPRQVLRAAAALRVTALLAVLAPLAWLVAVLAALPLAP